MIHAVGNVGAVRDTLSELGPGMVQKGRGSPEENYAESLTTRNSKNTKISSGFVPPHHAGAPPWTFSSCCLGRDNHWGLVSRGVNFVVSRIW